MVQPCGAPTNRFFSFNYGDLPHLTSFINTQTVPQICITLLDAISLSVEQSLGRVYDIFKHIL